MNSSIKVDGPANKGVHRDKRRRVQGVNLNGLLY